MAKKNIFYFILLKFCLGGPLCSTCRKNRYVFSYDTDSMISRQTLAEEPSEMRSYDKLISNEVSESKTDGCLNINEDKEYVYIIRICSVALNEQISYNYCVTQIFRIFDFIKILNVKCEEIKQEHIQIPANENELMKTLNNWPKGKPIIIQILDINTRQEMLAKWHLRESNALEKAWNSFNKKVFENILTNKNAENPAVECKQTDLGNENENHNTIKIILIVLSKGIFKKYIFLHGKTVQEIQKDIESKQNIFKKDPNLCEDSKREDILEVNEEDLSIIWNKIQNVFGFDTSAKAEIKTSNNLACVVVCMPLKCPDFQTIYIEELRNLLVHLIPYFQAKIETNVSL